MAPVITNIHHNKKGKTMRTMHRMKLEAMARSWGEDATQEEERAEELTLNTTKRWGNNRPHRSKEKRTQERKTKKASKKRNR